LILCLWIVSESYSQGNKIKLTSADTACVSKTRALELIIAELNYTKSLSIDSQQIAQIQNLQYQVDVNEGKVNDCMIANDALKRANAETNKEVQLKDSKIVDLEKDTKFAKITTKLVAGIGVLSEALTLYLFLR